MLTSPGVDPSGHARSPYATAPAWSLIGVVLGGLISVYLIPVDYYFLPGALVPATLVLTAGLLAGTVVAALRSPVSLFRVEHILSFGLFYWLLLDLVLGASGAASVSYDAIVRSFASISAFALALWLGSVVSGVWGRRPEGGAAGAAADLGPRFLFAAAVASGVLGMARVVFGCRVSPECIIDAFYNPRGSGAWLSIDAFGHFDTLFLYSQYFGFLVLPLTVALVSSEGRFTRRSVLTLLLGLICLVFLVGSGGRRSVGTIAGASLLTWGLMKDRVALRHLFGVAAAAVAIVLLMQLMLVARDIGIGAAIEQKLDFSRGAPIGTVDRNFRFLSHIIHLVPDKWPHNGWQGVAFAATLWVPGGLVPTEWQRRSIDLPGELGMSVGPGYSWTCTAIGDLHLIGGFPAILFGGLLFGVFARLASRLIIGSVASRRPILYALVAMTLFVSLRALHELFVTGFIVLAFSAFLGFRYVFRPQHRPGSWGQRRAATLSRGRT